MFRSRIRWAVVAPLVVVLASSGLSVGFGDDEAAFECNLCSTGGCVFGEEHKMLGDIGDKWAYHGECIETPTFCPHAFCGPLDQDLDSEDAVALLDDAYDGDFLAVTRMLDAYGEHVFINTDLNALQVMGCNDALRALIPLTERQVLVLTAID